MPIAIVIVAIAVAPAAMTVVCKLLETKDAGVVITAHGLSRIGLERAQPRSEKELTARSSAGVG